jgi:tRNA-2-methylthio-N6-dimethylallyladenosine synthase
VFSSRRGTEAATMAGQVPHPVKQERMERLIELVQRKALERSRRFIGRTQEVLVEGPSRSGPARLRGRTRHNKTVNFDGSVPAGELVEVEITGATSATLSGRLGPLSRAA